MKYAELTGKVGSRRSKLLTEGDYEELLRAGSVPAIADILSGKGYGDFIPDMDEIHRRDLEAAISKRFYHEVAEFKRLLTFPEKKVLAFMLLRCEIETLKRIFRLFVAGEELTERFVTCDLPFDPKSLLESASIDEIVSKLSGRPYHSILSSAMRREAHGTGYLENTLDYWYFSNLHRVIKRYGTRRILEFLQKQADLINALWIFRGRVLFGLEPDEVMSGLLPFGFHLRGNELREIAGLSDRSAIFEKLRRIPIFSGMPEGDLTVFVLERVGERYLYREAERLCRSTNGFEAVIGYLHLLEYETRNLVTVIEVVRYSLDPETAMAYVIRG